MLRRRISIGLSDRQKRLKEGSKEVSVSIRPFARGELASGNLKPRAEILQLLSDLPRASVASDHELLHLVENRKLVGLGIGLIEGHLLASALSDASKLYTRDKRLRAVAGKLTIACT